MYTVRDVMTREVVTLQEEDDLALADRILGLGKIRHLPVERNGRLVGLITHRDLLRAFAAARGRPARSIPARELMTRDIVTVSPDAALRRAAQVMLRQKLGCLPVISEEGRLVGILTESDLVRFAMDLVAELDHAAESLSRAH